MKQEVSEQLERVLSFAVSIDTERARHDVQRILSGASGKSKRAVARQLVRGTQWKTGAIGGLSGLPSNPYAGATAAIADVGYTLRQHMEMGSRIGCLYEPNFFANEYAQWELLAPALGKSFVSQLTRKTVEQVGRRATRRLVTTYLSKGTLKAFKSLTKKYLGKKILQRTVIAKSIPIVGAVISGGWNFLESGHVGKRFVCYFESEQI